MSRAGVTLLNVEQAILKLQGRGKNPSVDAVREVLGTGSKSTIAQHLRAWKAQQLNPQGKLPQDLLALVSGLWERLTLKAEQRIEETEEASSQRELELKQTLTELQQDHIRLQKQLHQSEEAQVTLTIAKETLETNLRTQQQEYAKLIERDLLTQQQLESQKAENSRLHQLANNIQANLEHYQQAVHQLQTEQHLAIEKQHAQLQQEITAYRQQVQHHEQQLFQRNTKLQQLQNEHHQLYEAHAELIREAQDKTQLLGSLQERCDQQQKITLDLEQVLIDNKSHMLAMERELAILADQKASMQKTLAQMEDKIETLRHEKIFLIQEKSELQGYLKQLERGTKPYETVSV
jgi:chromosome segregation ATPase